MTDTPAAAPAPDLVKQLLFRSSDEAGIGWTPNTVVHVPAGLLHNAADTITRLTAEVERLTAENTRLGEWDVAYDDRIQLVKGNERLRAALEPFAKYGTTASFLGLDVETPVSLVVEPHIVWLEDALKVWDFHAALAAIKEART